MWSWTPLVNIQWPRGQKSQGSIVFCVKNEASRNWNEQKMEWVATGSRAPSLDCETTCFVMTLYYADWTGWSWIRWLCGPFWLWVSVFQIKSKIIFGDYWRIKTALIMPLFITIQVWVVGMTKFGLSGYCYERPVNKMGSWEEKGEDRGERRRTGDCPTFTFFAVWSLFSRIVSVTC